MPISRRYPLAKRQATAARSGQSVRSGASLSPPVILPVQLEIGGYGASVSRPRVDKLIHHG
jgi:hypothetical protein